MKNELPLNIRSHTVLLLADKAIYWPQQKALLIADAHFGKAAAYRALGQPVPQGTTSQNLQRLNALLSAYPTEQLIFLGDFLHAPKSHAPATLAALRHWRTQHQSMKCILVRGNHDKNAGDPPADLNIETVGEPYLMGDFALQHIPAPHPTHHVIAGHIHPTFRLLGKGRQRLILPCFHHQEGMTLLPSFGDFTGGFVMENKAGDFICVTDGECIWSVPHNQQRINNEAFNI
ncbi:MULTISPECIES: ligase-associated DNA damage response endonuclease PdeM [unclassified Methylophilus]|uniref:ligase-associated DNA damage response endonuclease PdeM n=1 Tax=unclassified Methylophilus TaxID=2630143 RepID=UPI000701D772|nr:MULTISPECIES: ligase-associated DNA damage response endonuclease PdeM [unclassified Methylophilus]KQT42181.1 DEAD/DEAH box helicase [Methylophilus sp. Leaf416]KQT56362.1 DEAD/DEAH box helicase [Methylophilus sp. Leaf459]